MRAGARYQYGVSLIELMVALVIGLLLIAGAVTVYMQSRNTYRTTEAAARIQETGRYALSIIEPDVRMAGFWGMTNQPEQVEITAPAVSCGADWLGDADHAIEAFDASYPLSCTNANTGKRVASSDVLVVRRADSRISPVSAANIQVQSNRMRAVIFNDSSIPSDFGATTSETRNMVANVYYVAEPTAGQFSLRRFALRGTSMQDEEVIPGVEDLQIQFGVDNNGDGTADLYVDPDDVGTARVVSARIWLLIVSDEREIGYVDSNAYAFANVTHTALNDDRRRVVFTKTIQIRNSKP